MKEWSRYSGFENNQGCCKILAEVNLLWMMPKVFFPILLEKT
jgi:hypothetical protein